MYNPHEIEPKWQKYWLDHKANEVDDKSDQPKLYALDMFPYPSGYGLHVGHTRIYTASDVISRYYRMRGYSVLHPMGWDAFGLPAENYAIKTGTHPRISTVKNIGNIKKQMVRQGFSYDWSREIDTTDPNYYKWTQWIFLQLFKKGLAYEADAPINWCPSCKTGLANEEVIQGKCVRCGTLVERRMMKQWMLKITAYAERLLNDLKDLDWPEGIKAMQKNWIGRSEGIEIEYPLELSNENITFLHGYKGNPDANFWPWLRAEAEKLGAKVLAPKLPRTENPDVEEQVEYVLSKHIFNKDSVIVGHSLGGVVALKLIPHLHTKIKKLVLIATPSHPEFKDKKRPVVEVSNDWKFDYESIKSKVGEIVVIADKTDDVVPVGQIESMAKELNGKLFIVKAKKHHFDAKIEPEISKILFPKIKVFTTRPDTNFGATFVVLGPEHPFLSSQQVLGVEDKYWGEIEKYKKKVEHISEMDRLTEGKKKTGVFTGLCCINNLNGYKMPLYVSDYVLGHVGTGAVVGVPGHDKRDFEFSQIFDLPVIRVVKTDDEGPITSIDQVQEDAGTMVNSEFLNGLDIHAATVKIMDYFEEKGWGRRVVNYKLRDWVFSRQRYWGEPIPIIHCQRCGNIPVPESELPLFLPDVDKYEPTGTGESPLANILDWVNVPCPSCDGPAKRETNTMPQWAGSSWYYLRFTDPNNDQALASKENMDYWLPVDIYIGGAEHAVLHLLYARFWHKFLYDIHAVPHKEPFSRLESVGMVLANAYKDSAGRWVHYDNIAFDKETAFHKDTGEVLTAEIEKMSKSKGNVINPDQMIDKYGADTLRVYSMFLGPWGEMSVFSLSSIEGSHRFLKKVDALFGKVKDGAGEDKSIKRMLAQSIIKVTDDTKYFRFNTAVSQMMIMANAFAGQTSILKSDFTIFIQLLAPYAPHLAEELWQKIGHDSSVFLADWPEANLSDAKEELVTVVVQVNGKVRGKISVPSGVAKEDVISLAKSDENTKRYLSADIINTIFVPDKLINFVLKS